jgi:hypothetical protein
VRRIGRLIELLIELLIERLRAVHRASPSGS